MYVNLRLRRRAAMQTDRVSSDLQSINRNLNQSINHQFISSNRPQPSISKPIGFDERLPPMGGSALLEPNDPCLGASGRADMIAVVVELAGAGEGAGELGGSVSSRS